MHDTDLVFRITLNYCNSGYSDPIKSVFWNKNTWNFNAILIYDTLILQDQFFSERN